MADAQTQIPTHRAIGHIRAKKEIQAPKRSCSKRRPKEQLQNENFAMVAPEVWKEDLEQTCVLGPTVTTGVSEVDPRSLLELASRQDADEPVSQFRKTLSQRRPIHALHNEHRQVSKEDHRKPDILYCPWEKHPANEA